SATARKVGRPGR
nr:Chain P, DNA (cytosine-5)-methyltransferase 3A [Mus musculus]3SW9_Q Chain Q, DNA (cytosine-5)-methyltransferase 3A [Mus musculus]